MLQKAPAKTAPLVRAAPPLTGWGIGQPYGGLVRSGIDVTDIDDGLGESQKLEVLHEQLETVRIGILPNAEPGPKDAAGQWRPGATMQDGVTMGTAPQLAGGPHQMPILEATPQRTAPGLRRAVVGAKSLPKQPAGDAAAEIARAAPVMLDVRHV